MKIALDLEKIMNQLEPRFSRNLDDIAGCLVAERYQRSRAPQFQNAGGIPICQEGQ